MGRLLTVLVVAASLGVACATRTPERSEFRWKGAEEPSYRTFDMHRGKCTVYAKERQLKRRGRISWKHFYECMDDHGWEKKP